MPRKLSAAQVEAARILAEKVFEWERKCEEHCAILRQDPNQMTAAYLECARDAPPIGTLPPRDQWEQCMEQVASSIGEETATFVHRVKALNAYALLSRLARLKAAEEDNPMYNEMLRIKERLNREHVYEYVHMALPATLHPFLAQELRTVIGTSPSPSPSTPAYPLVLPADPFTSDSVQHRARTRVTPELVEGYRRNPEPLSSQTFVSSDDEYFHVASWVTAGRGKAKETLFYVVFADEGPEAVCHPSDAFFKLLENSEQLSSE